MRALSLALGATLILCACGAGDDPPGVAAGAPNTATAASLAQQTVGADMLPPDADIAGTATVSTELPAEDLSPDLADPNADANASTTDLLPPA